ncbi:hypothetical protein FGO68_gene3046 [Halteria grandinella]|uniref:Uncharacterized protein n=1 Tax=Halteria grandinella TaxID=5974 RepID=A0A8J8P4U3_HALGN|nr:hypothetical protein FGO68_gene3046 [Halteria grandinella]
MGSHYSNIKTCQNLLKNLKVLNTITPQMISDYVSQASEAMDAATALHTLHELWRNRRSASASSPYGSGCFAIIPTSTDLRGEDGRVIAEVAMPSEFKAYTSGMNSPVSYNQDEEQEGNGLPMIQIDEVSHSTENDLSQQQENFSIVLNQCEVLDMTAQKLLNSKVSEYQIQVQAQNQPPFSRNNEVLDQSSVRDQDLQRQTMSSALSKIGDPELEETLGLVYENDNHSVVRISHQVMTSMTDRCDQSAMQIMMNDSHNQTYQQQYVFDGDDIPMRESDLLQNNSPIEKPKVTVDREDRPLSSNPLTFEQLLKIKMKEDDISKDEGSSLQRDPKVQSELAILDQFEEFKRRTNDPLPSTFAQGKDLCESIDVSSFFQRPSISNGQSSKTFLKKGQGHVAKKIHQNWDKISISSLSKNSTQKFFFDSLNFTPSQTISKFGASTDRQEIGVKPFTRISDIYEKKAPESKNNNSSKFRDERISSLKERYSSNNKTQTKQPQKDNLPRTNFQSPLTSRNRSPLNNDLANVDDSLNISLISGQKRELSTQKKIKKVSAVTTCRGTHTLTSTDARKGMHLQQIKEERPKVNVSSRNQPLRVFQQLKIDAPKRSSLQPKENIQQQVKVKKVQIDMGKVQKQMESQEKIITVLRDEIKQREKEMKLAQERMLQQITRLERENLLLKKVHADPPLPFSMTARSGTLSFSTTQSSLGGMLTTRNNNVPSLKTGSFTHKALNSLAQSSKLSLRSSIVIDEYQTHQPISKLPLRKVPSTTSTLLNSGRTSQLASSRTASQQEGKSTTVKNAPTSNTSIGPKRTAFGRNSNFSTQAARVMRVNDYIQQRYDANHNNNNV